MPASKAARVILRQRLKGVLTWLPLAAKHADDDIEHVHQLRVWTRRSTAALDQFRDLIPDRRRRGLRKQLRQIRKAAGVARDLDVMLERFRREAEATRKRQLRDVVRNLARRRKRAQKELVSVRKAMKASGLKRSMRGVIRRTRWNGSNEPPFADCACDVLEQAAAQFFLRVCLETSDAEHLHEMRLDTKRFRYTVEIVAPAFGKRFRRQFYPELVSLQDALGRISDHRAASELFENWSDTSSSGRLLLKMSRQEHVAIGSAVTQLHDEWPCSRLDELRESLEAQLSRNMPGVIR